MKNPMVLLCVLAMTFESSKELDDDDDDDDGGGDGDLIRTLAKVFARKHVQTVTAFTCWSSDTDGRLLLELSSVDVSTSFHQTVTPTHDTWYKHGILVDVSCTRAADALFEQASKGRLFNTHNIWLLVDSSRRHSAYRADASSAIALETFRTRLGEAYVLPESSVFLFVETGHVTWELWEGFRVSVTEMVQVHRHGTATGDRLELDDDGSVLLKTDLRGITLKATTVISEPDKFKGFYPFTDVDLDIFAHMHNDLNTVLQHQLNFRMSLDIVNSFGWDLGNGSFSGLTGKLQREECDFGGIGSFIRADRMTAIDFTLGTFYRQPAVLFKQPPLSNVRNICILPFKFEVWMMMFFTFLGFTILILFLSRMSKKFKKDNNEEALTILDSMTVVHGAICQQGYAMNLNTVSIRIAVFVLFLTTVFLFTSYSASIVALLQSPSDSVKNIRDLIDSSMTFTAQKSPYGQIYFDETNDPLLQSLYEKKMKPFGARKFTLASEGVSRIRTEFHGFLVEVVSAHKLINHLWREEEKCGISQIQLFKLPILALAVVKKSGYKEILKQKLIQQQEVGIKNRIIRRWMPPKPMCDSSNRANQFISVSIKEIYPMLQIYGFGLCISVVILLLEIGYNNYVNYRENYNGFLS